MANLEIPAGECSACSAVPANLACGLCAAALCKECAEFAGEAQFDFLKEVPSELSFDCYCAFCYAQTVEPALEHYAAVMEQAKSVQVFYKEQSKETRLFRRQERAYQINDCVDREELILRLAFRAAGAGFDGLVDVQLTAQKIKNGGYQTSRWHGSGIPVQMPVRAPSR